jgi:heme A synthase
MARRLLIACVAALGSYVAGAFLGGWLVSVSSSNTHDLSVEAAMTGAFVFGPLAGLAGFVVGFVTSRPRTTSSSSSP